MKTIVETKNLRKHFPVKEGIFEAVRGVNLEIFQGEVFGFLGPNGAGKTTTLRMLTTLLPADGGEALVAGFDVRKEPQEVRKRIGYVSQKGGADESATARENLLLQGRLYGMSREEAMKRGEELLALLSLTEFADRFVHTFSGGQTRRLDIALGMMHRPAILFLDEPTTGLDPQNRANLWQHLRVLKEQGMTIFLTSHYLDEVDFLSDRLAIMDGGRIVALGTPKELKRQIAGDVVTLGMKQEWHSRALDLFKSHSFIREVSLFEQDLRLYVDQGEKALPQILRILDGENIAFEGLSLSLPSLNDVFLQKTGRSLRDEVKG